MEYTNNNLVKFTDNVDELIENKVKTSKSLSVKKKTNTKGMMQRLIDYGYSLIGMGESAAEAITEVGASAEQQAAKQFIDINDNHIDYKKSIDQIGNGISNVASDITSKAAKTAGTAAQISAIAGGKFATGVANEVGKHTINTISDTTKAVVKNVKKVNEQVTADPHNESFGSMQSSKTTNDGIVVYPEEDLEEETSITQKILSTKVTSLQEKMVEEDKKLAKAAAAAAPTTETPTTKTPTFQFFFSPTPVTSAEEKMFDNKQKEEPKQEQKQEEQENMEQQSSYEPMIDESRNIPGAEPTLSIYGEALNQFQKLFHLFGPGAIGMMTGQPALASAFMKFTENSKQMVDKADVARSFIDTMGPSLLKQCQRKN